MKGLSVPSAGKALHTPPRSEQLVPVKIFFFPPTPQKFEKCHYLSLCITENIINIFQQNRLVIVFMITFKNGKELVPDLYRECIKMFK